MVFTILKNDFNLITDDSNIIDFFNRRLEKSNNETDNYIKFCIDKVEMYFNGKKLIIEEKNIISDLYQIYNNFLSMIVNDDNTCYMHSVVISKNNEATLLLGTFGQGKTTFSLDSTKYGYEINSADHTVLSLENNKLYMIKGSLFVKIDDKTCSLDLKCTNKKIGIKKILLLYGLAKNGDLSIRQLPEKYIMKDLYYYCAWHFIMPLKAGINNELFNTKAQIVSFLNKITVPVFIVRGDNENILKYLENDLEK